MTVKELIEELGKYDPELVVYTWRSGGDFTLDEDDINEVELLSGGLALEIG